MQSGPSAVMPTLPGNSSPPGAAWDGFRVAGPREQRPSPDQAPGTRGWAWPLCRAHFPRRENVRQRSSCLSSLIGVSVEIPLPILSFRVALSNVEN